jgi:hypothetical protein
VTGVSWYSSTWLVQGIVHSLTRALVSVLPPTRQPNHPPHPHQWGCAWAAHPALCSFLAVIADVQSRACAGCWYQHQPATCFPPSVLLPNALSHLHLHSNQPLTTCPLSPPSATAFISLSVSALAPRQQPCSSSPRSQRPTHSGSRISGPARRPPAPTARTQPPRLWSARTRQRRHPLPEVSEPCASCPCPSTRRGWSACCARSRVRFCCSAHVMGGKIYTFGVLGSVAPQSHHVSRKLPPQQTHSPIMVHSLTSACLVACARAAHSRLLQV